MFAGLRIDETRYFLIGILWPYQSHRLGGGLYAGNIPKISPRDSQAAAIVLLFFSGAGSGCRWRCQEQGFFRGFRTEVTILLVQPAGQPFPLPELSRAVR